MKEKARTLTSAMPAEPSAPDSSLSSELAQRAVGAREVSKAEVADDAVERVIGEGKIIGVGLAKVDTGVLRHSEFEHSGREVNARTTAAPRLAARKATTPGPVATSRTRAPALTAAAS